MPNLANYMGCIPLLPLLAAALIAVSPRRATRFAIGTALLAMAGATVLSLILFISTVSGEAEFGVGGRQVINFEWFRLGSGRVELGFVLDPLAAIMLLMVSFVGLLIFIFSVGYMAEDDNTTRFFGFLSMFAAAMLGLVISNSLLLFFACWEVMGLASYLLIGFWFHKPSAAAAARKAFIVTRIGDLGLFLGMLWLYHATGTLLFFDGGNGAFEGSALNGLAATTAMQGMTVATAISLLLFVGAVGKSGQFPLHVWLPDAMEGPTPVSALIHAATMVAAGVFLVARAFPVMTAGAAATTDASHASAAVTPALVVVASVGGFTALFAACIAVAQSDIKRILAYSTVSQLGYMFLGIAVGGVAVGMFHLITHAFFKALLFLGAGSVIHGCREEQDIRWMGGIRRWMPWTFATYAIGMMALAGVPLLFSGFWSKDEILHAAWLWRPSRIPFFFAIAGAFLTAFYMTRQMLEVFYGVYRGPRSRGEGEEGDAVHSHGKTHHDPHHGPVHESPPVMTGPLLVLAIFAVLLGFLGTPAWPWFENYLTGHHAIFDTTKLSNALPMMLISTLIVALGIGTGWLLYGRKTRASAEEPDALEAVVPRLFHSLRQRLWVDEIYRATAVRLHSAFSALAGWLDSLVIGGLVVMTAAVFRLIAYVARWIDELIVNGGFDAGCDSVRRSGLGISWLQGGRAQRYLGGLGLGMVLLTLFIIWGLKAG